MVSRIGVLFLVVAMLLVSACGTTTPTTAPTAAPADGQSAPAPPLHRLSVTHLVVDRLVVCSRYMLMSFP